MLLTVNIHSHDSRFAQSCRQLARPESIGACLQCRKFGEDTLHDPDGWWLRLCALRARYQSGSQGPAFYDAVYVSLKSITSDSWYTLILASDRDGF